MRIQNNLFKHSRQSDNGLARSKINDSGLHLTRHWKRKLGMNLVKKLRDYIKKTNRN